MDLQELEGSLPGCERGSDGHIVRLHPDWINIGDLQRWIQTCDRKHGTQCRHMTPQPKYPEWLIDVWEYCIVPGLFEYRYVALSYVWGQVTCSALPQDTVKEFQKPYSLSSLNESVTIPKTILHAMGLVRKLSLRYLCVDRFCICQDDVQSKHSQISIIGDIYRNAYVTIIAANGWDADHGLRGIKGVTEPRQISPNFDHDYMESLQPYSSVWYSRGWTFQELVLSKRKIFFHYQVALWECPRAFWHEATDLSGNVPTTNEGYRDLQGTELRSMTPWGFPDLPTAPDCGQYFSMVSQYNQQKLTYPEDICNAFTGVVSALEDVFPRGLIWGLPVISFGDALLWVPLEESQRRLAKSSSDILPSWSWLAWEGPITSPQGPSKRRRQYPEPLLFRATHTVCRWRWPWKARLDEQLRVSQTFPTASRSLSLADLSSHESHVLEIKIQTARLPIADFVYWLDGAGFSAPSAGVPYRLVSPQSLATSASAPHARLPRTPVDVQKHPLASTPLIKKTNDIYITPYG